jgi:hypothetical protein
MSKDPAAEYDRTSRLMIVPSSAPCLTVKFCFTPCQHYHE